MNGLLALLGAVVTVAGLILFFTTSAPSSGLITFIGTLCLAIAAWRLNTRKDHTR